MGDRHQFRADWHDYNEGIYFVTICCADKKHFFGHISDGIITLNEIGEKADEFLNDIPTHHDGVEIHNHIVMPNHVHILLQLVGTRHVASASTGSTLPPGSASTGSTLPPGSASTGSIKPETKMGCIKPSKHGMQCKNNHFNSRLAVVIGSYKSAVTRYVKEMNLGHLMRTRHVASLPVGSVFAIPVWQKRFHEHLVRNQHAYDNINEYITNNPLNWNKDCFHG